MKKIIISCCLLVVVIMLVNVGRVEGEEIDIKELFYDFFIEYITRDPEMMTRLGDLTSLEIEAQNHMLTDRSIEAILEEYSSYDLVLEELMAFDTADLSHQDKLNRAILEWFLSDKIREKEFVYHKYAIDQLWGVQVGLPDLMINNHKIESIKDADDYITRLGQFKRVFGQVVEMTRLQKEKGIVPPTYIIRTVKNQSSQFISSKSKENPLYTNFVQKVEKLDLDDKQRQELYHKVKTKIENNVYPAYQIMINYLEEIDTQQSIRAGVWELPRGDEYYRYLLRHYTTTDLTPEEIHKFGLLEVKRIQKEIRKTVKEMDTDYSSPGWVVMSLERNAYNSREKILAKYQEIIRDVERKLPEMFDILPENRVSLAPVPGFKEDSISNYYSSPSFDGSHGGTFYVNLSYSHAPYRMPTLAYHETIPGHHIQRAIQRENTDLPYFNRILSFTGYTEGWALYAEQLVGEYGFHQDLAVKLGYLRSELFRASRLVIDTGIHYKQWSRVKANSYFREVNGYGNLSEINRYIVMPGQACAYKIGQLKILELRKKAKTELGDKFDIKEFHNIVLQNGSLPLEILEKEVNRYIESKS